MWVRKGKKDAPPDDWTGTFHQNLFFTIQSVMNINITVADLSKAPSTTPIDAHNSPPSY
jgi:hypothetical protein